MKIYIVAVEHDTESEPVETTLWNLSYPSLEAAVQAVGAECANQDEVDHEGAPAHWRCHDVRTDCYQLDDTARSGNTWTILGTDLRGNGH